MTWHRLSFLFARCLLRHPLASSFNIYRHLYSSVGVSHVGDKRLVVMTAAREGSQNGEAVTGVEVRVACFEVCGKNVFDLLKNGEKLDVREDSYGSVQVLSDSG